jgi:hypothetical protein
MRHPNPFDGGHDEIPVLAIGRARSAIEKWGASDGLKEKAHKMLERTGSDYADEGAASKDLRGVAEHIAGSPTRSTSWLS